jgi:hypothetical protein
MAYVRPPAGITPPAPGLDREEPTFVPEEDIPSEVRVSAEGPEERPQRTTDVE